MKRVALTLLSCSLFSLAASAADQPPAAAPAPAPAAAEAGFKDLQVLPKDIKKEDLKAMMKGFTAALGVKCVHCHEMPTPWKETKKKLAAREMIKMTNSINSTFLKGKDQITCETCHRGADEPTVKIKHKE